ncbi:MAG: beta-ketoacyl-ACP reductase [Methylocella sp.]
MNQLANQMAVVTGAGRGIGRAIALKFAAEGADVVCVSRTPENSEKVAAEIRALGRKAWAHAVDVADATAVNATAEKILVECGRVDILVNNAGVTRDTMFHKMTPEQWYEVININLNSLFNMTRPVIEGMRERGFGRIVNISSINGQKGQVGQTNYTASKSGDIGFTKSLAQENAGKGITVNTVCPGYIATDMVKAVPKEVLEKSVLPLIPVRRLGEPEEVARCVVFLVAEESGYITGSTLTINGGQYMV